VNGSETFPDFDPTLSPGDTMFAGGEHYVATGRSALHNVRVALRAAERPAPRRILDLPCGHGRVLRHLRAEFPDAEIVAGDLDVNGVEFCAERFGAIPAISAPEPERVRLPSSFDLIFCGSLLTHLPKALCARWLLRFEDLLAPGGLLLLTTHGRMTRHYIASRAFDFGLGEAGEQRVLRGYDTEGFGYADYPNRTDYGISLMHPAWLVREVTDRERLRVAYFAEAAWLRHQDVLACTPLREPEDSARVPPPEHAAQTPPSLAS